MKILAPLSKPDEVPLLVKAGASELYCGVVDRRWQDSYGYVSNINLRHDRAANLQSFTELKAAVEKAHSNGVQVFLAINSHFYSQDQLPLVLEHAARGIECGVDSLIVADASLIPKLKKEFRADISLSTAAHAFNNSALDFFKGLGISRVVFPRHLAVSEIAGLAKHAKEIGLSTECFMFNALCPYIDGLCTFQHIFDESVSFAPLSGLSCRLPYEVTAVCSDSAGKKLAAESHVKLWNNSHYRDCGLCALPAFNRFGLDTVKVAGRAMKIEEKVKDVKILSKATALLNGKEFDEKKFKERCRVFYFELFHNTCDHLHCYYAEAGLE